VVTADPIRWLSGEGVAPTGVEAHLPVPPPDEQRAAILRHDFVFIGSLFERRLYDDVGGFREQFHGTEDWDLWIRMIRHGAVVRRASHPTVLYRLSTGSVSADERLVGQERKVVLAAIEESDRDEDRAVLTTALRHVDAKAAMYAAYEAARRGQAWRARRLALGGVRGPGRVPSRCVALLAAPRWAVRARDRRVHQTRWWLRP
jgi:GT2 family glycosyltransferase